MFIIHNEINLIFRINCQKILYSLTIKHWHDSYFFTSIMAFYSNNRLLYSNVYSLYRREQLFDLGIIALMSSLCRYGVLLQVQATAYCSSSGALVKGKHQPTILQSDCTSK